MWCSIVSDICFVTGKYNSNTGLPDDSQGSLMRPQLQTAEQRHVLRMLEKSLAWELDFEKKLTALKQNEEDLKLKLQLTEQVSDRDHEPVKIVEIMEHNEVMHGKTMQIRHQKDQQHPLVIYL